MTTKEIKSGPQIVTDFLESLKGNNAIDAKTLKTVGDLYASGKLSKPRLLRSLEDERKQSLSSSESAPKKADANE